jgi:cytochrome bd-type quinol oxidase subunit 2
MGLPIKLVWSNLRNEAARRWVAFPVVALAALLGSLGWSVAMFNSETGGGVRVVGRWTVLLFALSFLLALMMGLVLLLRGRLHWPYLPPEQVAIQMLNAMLWTPGILGIVSISLGIVIYGKKFLRIEVFLDILKALRPG